MTASTRIERLINPIHGRLNMSPPYQLSPEHVARIALIYSELDASKHMFEHAIEEQGPNGIIAQHRAARVLADRIIPDYIRTIPLEVQRHLPVNVNELQERCRCYRR